MLVEGVAEENLAANVPRVFPGLRLKSKTQTQKLTKQ